MSIGYVKRVTFLCPAVITGGPEAIHQAAHLLNQQGLPANIAYYGEGANHRFEGGRLIFGPPETNPCLEKYSMYEPVVCTEALMRRHHLIVIPEPLAASAGYFQPASTAIWWLSVDNGMVGVDEVGRQRILSDRSVKHFHQSAYAEDFLRRSGVPLSHPLADFTDADFTSIVPLSPNREDSVAYNPAKGGHLADAFFGANPEVSSRPIQGMSKAEIVALLRSTMVYVDFGGLPGKDRLPREAAASGAIVFLHNRGAGRFHEDFPISDFFRFEEGDIASGELARKLAFVRADPVRYWTEQEPFREVVRAERSALNDQLLMLRGKRRAA